MTLALYTAGAPGELAGPLRDLVRSLDPGQPVSGIRTMDEIFDVRARGILNVLIGACGSARSEDAWRLAGIGSVW